MNIRSINLPPLRFMLISIALLGTVLFSTMLSTWQIPISLLAIPAVIFVFVLAHRPFELFCLQLFILTTFPFTRIVIGGIPFYIAEVLLGICLFGIFINRSIKLRRDIPLLSWVILFTVNSLVATFGQMWLFDAYLVPTYSILRHVLYTLGMYYVVCQLLRTRQQIMIILGVMTVGVTANGILSILQSFSQTQELSVAIVSLVYDDSVFSAGFQNRYTSGVYHRGIGFFKAATIMGGYLAFSLPLVYARTALSDKRWLAILVPVIVGSGMLVTVARHAVVSLVIAVLIHIVLIQKNISRLFRLAILISIGLLIVITTNLDAGTITDRWSDLGAGGLSEPNIEARVIGHKRYWDYWNKHPFHAFIGRGPGADELIDQGVVQSEYFELVRGGFVSDSYPLMMYDVGMIGGIVYVVLIVNVIWRLRNRILSESDDSQVLLTTGIFMSLIVASIAHIFDNYFAVNIVAKGIFWFLLGLGTTLTQDEDEYLSTQKLGT